MQTKTNTTKHSVTVLACTCYELGTKPTEITRETLLVRYKVEELCSVSINRPTSNMELYRINYETLQLVCSRVSSLFSFVFEEVQCRNNVHKSKTFPQHKRTHVHVIFKYL